MRTGYTQIDEWPVRLYSKRELAMAYAPEISPVSALNRLAEWVRYNSRLTRELSNTGYRSRQRVFTFLQVELIFRYLSRPREETPPPVGIGERRCRYWHQTTPVLA